MANNTFQVKRTSTSGRTPNTTSSSNGQYIAAGELALNMADGILYSSNGSTLITVGANTVNHSVTGTLTVNALSSNGSVGTSGQYLTSNGTTTYWSTPATVTVNQAAQYTWTNTQSFTNTITFNSATFYNTNLQQAPGNNFSANSYATLGGGGSNYLAFGQIPSNYGQWIQSGYPSVSSPVYYNIYLNPLGGKVGVGGNTSLTNTFTVNGTSYFDSAVTIKNDVLMQFQTVNSSAYAGFKQQSDDNFVFYTTNTSYGTRAVFSIFANSVTSTLSFSAPVTFNGTAYLGTAALSANGSVGSAGQYLTSDGTKTYWSSPGAASVNVAAQYSWTNTQTFSANITFSGNGIGFTTNTGAIYFNGINDSNWRIGRNAGGLTKSYYTGNTLDVIAYSASPGLEGFAIGQSGANVWLETGYNGTYTKNPIYIGNSTVNTTVNSTSFVVGTGSFLANSTGVYTGVVNATSHTTGTGGGSAAGGITVNSTFISIGNTTVNAGIGFVNTAGTTTFLQILGSANASVDNITVNYNTSGNASADFAAYDSNGPTSSNFIDMGINGSGWSNTLWTINGPSDGYLYTGNTNLSIGTAAATNYINFFTGGTLLANERLRITNTSIVISNTISITANNSTGTSGQVLASNGSAVYWTNTVSGLATIVRQQFTANGSVNTYTVTSGYTANNLDVYVNGVKLYNGTEVNVASGSTFTILTGNPPANALIDVVGVQSFVANVSGITVGNSVIGYNSITVGNATINSVITSTSITSINATHTGTTTLAAVSANGGVGTSGQVLSSNGSSTYWANTGASIGDAIVMALIFGG